MEETREVLVNQIVDEVMSKAGDLADSCGCGCGPDIPPIGNPPIGR